MIEPLSTDEKNTLLLIARNALEGAVRNKPLPSTSIQPLTPRLQELGSSFVTLTTGGVLRGCIGSIEPSLPLAEDVRQHAADAALRDYRFSPVRPDDLSSIDIEVSVLTPMQPLDYDRPEDLLNHLRPGVDGVLIQSGKHRATFLPQVWEKIPEPALFLNTLCKKAFLLEDFWRKEKLQVFTYQVEHFHEPTDR